MLIYPSTESIQDKFSAFLLDAFGVFWGGNSMGPFEAAKKRMQELCEAKKVVGILSNSTISSKKEIEKLARHGIVQGTHFHFMVTSGDVARHLFLINQFPFTTHQKKYFLVHGHHPKYKGHVAIFEGSGFLETTDMKEADFLYVNVPHVNGEDVTDPKLFEAIVEEVLQSNLPMVCANPDLFAHEGEPVRSVVRQGSTAKMYQEKGGEVFYIGKPAKPAFDLAIEEFRRLNIHQLDSCLMVGDTPETDIEGANLIGMPSALLTKTGMMADRIHHVGFEAATAALHKHQLPDFFIERL